MNVNGTATLGSVAADTAITILGRLQGVTAIGPNDAGLCTVSRAFDGRYGAAPEDATLVCTNTGFKHLKVPDAGGAAEAGVTPVEFLVGRLVRKASGGPLVFDGTLPTSQDRNAPPGAPE